MILEAKFTESAHELHCDASVAVVIGGGVDSTKLDNHINDINNPHKITCDQIGAVTQEQLQSALENVVDEVIAALPVYNGEVV